MTADIAAARQRQTRRDAHDTSYLTSAAPPARPRNGMAIAPRQPTPLRTTTVLRHTLPFAARVAATVLWAYDADELAEVRLGKRAPWGALPYAYWQLSLPFGDRTGDINGAAYDTQTRRIYLTGALADEQRPLVHVYSVGRGGAEGKPRTAPKTLR